MMIIIVIIINIVAMSWKRNYEDQAFLFDT